MVNWVLCTFGFQLRDPVAEKKMDIDVWDSKFAETCIQSIVSESFIYIAIIHYY